MRIAQNATGVGAALVAAQTAAAMFAGPMQHAHEALSRIISEQSKAQNTQLELTSAFRAYEVFGHTSDQMARATAGIADDTARQARMTVLQSEAFETAGRASVNVMRQITRDAARLPGTAEQYLMVFQQALPAALANTHQQVSSIASLTNQGAAVAIANGIDAAQAGRDMMEMFNGHANMMNRTYTVLGPLMTRSATDHRRLTQEGFNHMTGENRFLAMQRALVQYAPMLDHMGNSWEAMTGTFESAISEMIKGSTGEIFQTAVTTFGALNRFIERYADQLTRVGTLLSHWSVQAFDVIGKQASEAFEQLKDMGNWIMGQPWFNQILNMGTHVATGIAARTVGPGATNNSRIGMAATATAALGGGVTGGVLFGSFLHFMENAGAVARVMQSLQSAVAAVLPVFERVSDMIMSASALGGSIMVDVLPAVAEFVSMLVRGGAIVANTTITVLTPVFRLMGHAVAFAGHQFSMLIGELGGMTTVVRFALKAFATLTGIVGNALALAINAAIAGFGMLMGALRGLVHFINFLTHRRTSSAEELGGHIPTRDEQHPAWLDQILAAINQVDKTAKTTDQQNAGRHGQPPTQRGGTNNDFRYSRFDITQKFSEGFDPDRIAAVFTNDLERMANNRTQSGFEPAFGLS